MGVCGGTSALDECGVCNGPGIDEAAGYCDCYGNVIDECGKCGGEGVPPGWLDCHTPPREPNTHDRVVDSEARKRVEAAGG